MQSVNIFSQHAPHASVNISHDILKNASCLYRDLLESSGESYLPSISVPVDGDAFDFMSLKDFLSDRCTAFTSKTLEIVQYLCIEKNYYHCIPAPEYDDLWKKVDGVSVNFEELCRWCLLSGQSIRKLDMDIIHKTVDIPTPPSSKGTTITGIEYDPITLRSSKIGKDDPYFCTLYGYRRNKELKNSFDITANDYMFYYTLMCKYRNHIENELGIKVIVNMYMCCVKAYYQTEDKCFFKIKPVFGKYNKLDELFYIVGFIEEHNPNAVDELLRLKLLYRDSKEVLQINPSLSGKLREKIKQIMAKSK